MAKEIVLMLGQVVVLVNSQGSSVTSGKCSGEGLHNVRLYMLTRYQGNTPSSSCKDTFVVRE